jgi:hypothetical protein
MAMEFLQVSDGNSDGNFNGNSHWKIRWFIIDNFLKYMHDDVALVFGEKKSVFVI